MEIQPRGFATRKGRAGRIGGEDGSACAIGESDCESLGRIPRSGMCGVTKYSFSR